MILKNRETYIRIFAFALVSAAVLSVLARSNTLLFHNYRFDYIIFKLMGNGWAAGHIPFRDLFDHKGPVVFFIQMLASLISRSKVVIWVLEVVWMAVTFEMLYRCGRYVGASKRLSYLSIMVALMVYACFVDGGNTVEVWSLPFEVLPLLLLLRSLSGCTKLTTTSFVGGLCFGIVAMTRINNNAMITGLVVGMVIYLCYRKEYGQVLHCAGWFLSGMIIAILPFVIYFWSAGALDDMIYCTFTYNMRYMGLMAPKTSFLYKTMNLCACIVFLPVLCLYSIKKRIKRLLVLAPVPVVVFLAFYPGAGFMHYYLMTMPVAVLSIQMLSPLTRCVRVPVFGIYFMACGYNLNMNVPPRIENIRYQRAKEAIDSGLTGEQFISDFIPDGEKGSIYVYGDMDPSAAVDANGYSPAGKYFFNQDIIQSIDPWAHDDIIAKFREANPKWVIVASETISPLEGCMSGYKEVARDSLPPSCPGTWHIYIRK